MEILFSFCFTQYLSGDTSGMTLFVAVENKVDKGRTVSWN
jgi:hypothetical protein